MHLTRGHGVRSETASVREPMIRKSRKIRSNFRAEAVLGHESTRSMICLKKSPRSIEKNGSPRFAGLPGRAILQNWIICSNISLYINVFHFFLTPRSSFAHIYILSITINQVELNRPARHICERISVYIH